MVERSVYPVQPVRQGSETSSLSVQFLETPVPGKPAILGAHRHRAAARYHRNCRSKTFRFRSQAAHTQSVLILNSAGDRTRPARRGVCRHLPFMLPPELSLAGSGKCSSANSCREFSSIYVSKKRTDLPQCSNFRVGGVEPGSDPSTRRCGHDERLSDRPQLPIRLCSVPTHRCGSPNQLVRFSGRAADALPSCSNRTHSLKDSLLGRNALQCRLYKLDNDQLRTYVPTWAVIHAGRACPWQTDVSHPHARVRPRNR